MQEDLLDESFRTESLVNSQKEPSLPNSRRGVLAILSIVFTSVIQCVIAFQGLAVYTNKENVLQYHEAIELYQFIGNLRVLSLLLSSVLFLAWFSRAYKNVWRREKTEMSPGWAIGSWFIPVYSLFKPIQLAREIMTKNSNLINSKPSNGTIVAWWFFWVSSSILANLQVQLNLKSLAISDEVLLSMSMITSMAGALSGVFCISYISKIKYLETRIFNSEQDLINNSNVD